MLGGSPAIPTYLARIVDALQQDMVPSDWLHPHAQPSPHSLTSWLKGNACAFSFLFSFFFFHRTCNSPPSMHFPLTSLILTP